MWSNGGCYIVAASLATVRHDKSLGRPVFRWRAVRLLVAGGNAGLERLPFWVRVAGLWPQRLLHRLSPRDSELAWVESLGESYLQPITSGTVIE